MRFKENVGSSREFSNSHNHKKLKCQISNVKSSRAHRAGGGASRRRTDRTHARRPTATRLARHDSRAYCALLDRLALGTTGHRDREQRQLPHLPSLPASAPAPPPVRALTAALCPIVTTSMSLTDYSLSASHVVSVHSVVDSVADSVAAWRPSAGHRVPICAGSKVAPTSWKRSGGDLLRACSGSASHPRGP